MRPADWKPGMVTRKGQRTTDLTTTRKPNRKGA